VVTGVVTAKGNQDNQGYCSRCGKIWTLQTEQGVCRWCGKLATCQTRRTQALRSFKSSRSRRRKQAEIKGNGYNNLIGEWLNYYKVASRFTYKVKPQDREDILHDILITLAGVARNNGHKPFTEAVMYRIASRVVTHYWYEYYRIMNGLDCRHCSKKQRQRCKADWLYRQCPKAVKLESLNMPIIDDNGNTTELGELIADDKAIDLEAWIEAKTFLSGFPQRLLMIAQKLNNGEKLTATDSQYLWRYRKKQQKYLFAM
jgi:hypothetical protein